MDQWLAEKANFTLAAYSDAQLITAAQSIPVNVWESTHLGPGVNIWQSTGVNYGTFIDVSVISDDPSIPGLNSLPFLWTEILVL